MKNCHRENQEKAQRYTEELKALIRVAPVNYSVYPEEKKVSSAALCASSASA